jgi:aspartyl-tRNA(Asn)/glutamyl-tRNA(Gln) amidotransferase subunit A
MDPVQMYLNDVFTVTANLAGVPAMSLPAGLDETGLPLGLQLIGRHLDEGTLFSLAGVLEKAADFRAKPRAWWKG